MKNKELDHVDREILRMLQEDARMSLKDIAEAVFLSSPAVSVRIDNMIEAGYIEGFHATVNPVKMGYHIKAFINLKYRRSIRSSFIRISKPARMW